MRYRIADMTPAQIAFAEDLIDEALRLSSSSSRPFDHAKSAMWRALGLPNSHRAAMRLLNDEPEPEPLTEAQRSANRRANIEQVMIATGHRSTRTPRNVTPR